MIDTIKVVIVDDHEIFRNGLKNILGRIEYIDLSGTCTNGIDFILFLKENEVDVVLMDVKMPEMDGISATREALAIKPDTKIIALSMFGDEENLKEMLHAGAKGFLLKNITGRDLERAISVVADGGNYYSEELLTFFTKRFIKDAEEEANDYNLSKRELEVLQLVSLGNTNQEIADKLFISKRTVDGHKNSLIVKTGSKNMIDLLIYAIKNKLVKIL